MYGPNAANLLEDNQCLFTSSEKIVIEDNIRLISSNPYSAGLPERIVWNDNLGLIMHGIAFPKNASIDDLASNPEQILGDILRQYKDHPTNIPYAFLNGSYVGIVIDKANKNLYAFTSFLNSIPLYYVLGQDTLILSTSFEILVKITGKKINRITNGMIEYYQLGTNLSDFTPVEGIKSVAKGAYIEYDGKKIKHDFFYKMPSVEENRTFDVWVDSFASLWEKSTNGLHSKSFKYGLGFTGGIDSRLIMAGIKNKDELLYFTGSHKDDLDYVLAKQITSAMGLSEHHVLEDYSQSDFTKGYVDYLAISDNLILNNKVYNLDQLKFRQQHDLVFELTGLTEYLGGVYHYTDRRKLSNTINMGLPLKLHKLEKPTAETYLQLAFLGLRNTTLHDYQSLISPVQNQEYENMMQTAIMFLNQQINTTGTMENYLERFRHIHKMANLLSWNRINGRPYVELLSPSMNIEITDFTARIPLRHRESRKLLLAYLKKYHPQLSKFVLSGYIFSADSPWWLYKTLSPYIKVMNHLGIKIPFLQWYINSNSDKSFINQKQICKFQKLVVLESDLIQEFLPHLNAEVDNIGNLKLLRLFNLALLNKQLLVDEHDFTDYLYERYNRIL